MSKLVHKPSSGLVDRFAQLVAPAHGSLLEQLSGGAGLFRSLVDTLEQGVYIVDLQRTLLYWNRGAEVISGYLASDIVGRHCYTNILGHCDAAGRALCFGGCPLQQTIEDGERRSTRVYLHHAEGHRVPVDVVATPIRDATGATVGAVEVFTDCSAQLDSLEELERLRADALIDELCGVANRRYTGQIIDARTNQFKRHGESFGLLFADLDNFKKINDTFGHNVGDRVLRAVAKTIASSLRNFDFVGRWGGDEFVALLSHVRDESVLREVGDRILALVHRSTLRSGDRPVRVTLSIGATVAQADDSPETIIERADKLMYASKAAGGNRLTVEI